MKVIGIVGGIGAGKTTVVSILTSVKSTFVIGADEIGHQILLKEGKAYQKVVDEFGSSILDEEGNIVRARLGALVFGHPEGLKKLNQISHPIIFEEVKAKIQECKRNGQVEWIIIDAALLIEIGLVRLTNEVIGVYADDSVRIERLIKRNNLTREEALKRINSQKKWEELKQVLSYEVDNTFSYEQTERQIKDIVASW